MAYWWSLSEPLCSATLITPRCRFLWALSQTTLLSPLPATQDFPVQDMTIQSQILPHSSTFRNWCRSSCITFQGRQRCVPATQALGVAPLLETSPFQTFWWFNITLVIFIYIHNASNLQLCWVMLSVRYTALTPSKWWCLQPKYDEWIYSFFRESLQEKNGQWTQCFWWP